MMIERVWLGWAGLSGALAVAAEAAARHLSAGDAHRLELVAIAARYGLIHSLALFAAAVFAASWRRGAGRGWLIAAGWAFAAGLGLFCGSLYLLALGGPAVVAAATPIGGTFFIVGWAALFVMALAARWPAE
ncbi:MAG TPA: DUF423 domain-containing protein [Stellaceae bacterium]|nr:DUF423 domain-containing protein [Stellaceae bacterium]